MNPIGFSTGALALGDFRAALECLAGKPVNVIELSALRINELPVLLDAVPSLKLDQFRYISLHVPSLFSDSEEVEIVRLLDRTPMNWKLILHPDTIHESERWLRFGERLVLENTDRRKPDGRSADELSLWFQRLPQARLCLDLAHAQQWDTTMTEAYLLLKIFANRLCQIHISQLDSASHHHPLSISSVRAFSEIAWLIPDGIPFIIESRILPEEMDGEIETVQRIVSSVPVGAREPLPA